MKDTIFISGGAGYVGTVLTKKLLEKKYNVIVYDTFWFWDSPDSFVKKMNLQGQQNLRIIVGDIRDKELLNKSLKNIKTVIHLACISNDPSSDLNSDFTHSINYTGNINVIDEAKKAGVSNFIYASSSSVYGVKQVENVIEEMTLEPLTQYSKLKVEIEKYLLTQLDDKFRGVVIRPSTVCGYSPRQRLDVIVNILTNNAINKNEITLFGGEQLRPNIHIDDMTNLYLNLIEEDFSIINKKIYNAGWENLKVKQIASIVNNEIPSANITYHDTDDIRSYHVSSQKILNELGFKNKKTVRDAVIDLKYAFEHNLINSNDINCYNVKKIKEIIRG